MNNLKEYILEKLHIDKNSYAEGNKSIHEFKKYLESNNLDVSFSSSVRDNNTLFVSLSEKDPYPMVSLNLNDNYFNDSTYDSEEYDEFNFDGSPNKYELLIIYNANEHTLLEDFDKQFDVNDNGIEYTKHNADLIYKKLKKYKNFKSRI